MIMQIKMHKKQKSCYSKYYDNHAIACIFIIKHHLAFIFNKKRLLFVKIKIIFNFQ